MSKPKQIIAVDIDDVLADELPAMREFINKTYGLQLTAEDYDIESPHAGFWLEVWGVGKEEGQARYRAFTEAQVPAQFGILNGALEGIERLKQKYTLVIVTARDQPFTDVTHTWLSKHFPETFKRIEFVHAWSTDEKVSKAVICKQIGADFLIDDSLEHCEMAAEAGLQVVLYGDYGWNRRATEVAGITRAKDWQAVLEYFGV
jgi:uncharacterized HAD superfamily protein